MQGIRKNGRHGRYDINDVVKKCLSEDHFDAPRSISLVAKFFFLRFKRPEWAQKGTSDPIDLFYRLHKKIMKKGYITWGHIIQANKLMWEPGARTCVGGVGEVVYSEQRAARISPSELGPVAEALSSLKGGSFDDPELQNIGDYLYSGKKRVFGLEVPRSVSPKFRCLISSTMFIREHLLGEFLLHNYLPIYVNKEDPKVVVPVPYYYWANNLHDMWDESFHQWHDAR